MISKLTCSVLLIFFILSVSNLSSQSLHFDKLRLKESFQRIEFSIDSLNDSNNTKLTEKSPLFAGSISFIVPGLALGQFYNEQIFKGLLHVGISGIGFYLFISGSGMHGNSESRTIGYTGFILYLSNWLYTIFDAIASADNINKQIKLQKYRSGVLDKLKFGLTLDKNKNLNLKFAFEL